jgi:hypothetical protein
MADTMKSIESIHHPGKTYRRDAGKIAAVESAMLKALPSSLPGLTWAELKPRVAEHVPEELFPGGAKLGWWMKSVQLDLEAKGVIARTAASPLRFHRI